jgi:hypothetical protein
MELTIHNIKDLLATNPRAVGRALIVLRNRQTADERSEEHTKYRNGRGFRPCHARMGTSMADFFEKRGYLSEKQVAYWRKPMADGNTRIEIYARQLLEEAQAKAAMKYAETMSKKFREQAAGEDLGNYAEEKMVWEEMNGVA